VCRTTVLPCLILSRDILDKFYVGKQLTADIEGFIFCIQNFLLTVQTGVTGQHVANACCQKIIENPPFAEHLNTEHKRSKRAVCNTAEYSHESDGSPKGCGQSDKTSHK
jgi:hypothetical protein